MAARRACRRSRRLRAAFALAGDVLHHAGVGRDLGQHRVGVGKELLVGFARLPGGVAAVGLLGLFVGGSRLAVAALGLVARCVPAGTHEQAALDLAERIAERPALSVSLAKQVLDQGLDSSFEVAMGREVEHAVLTSLQGEDDGPRTVFSGRPS